MDEWEKSHSVKEGWTFWLGHFEPQNPYGHLVINYEGGATPGLFDDFTAGAVSVVGTKMFTDRYVPVRTGFMISKAKRFGSGLFLNRCEIITPLPVASWVRATGDFTLVQRKKQRKIPRYHRCWYVLIKLPVCTGKPNCPSHK